MNELRSGRAPKTDSAGAVVLVGIFYTCDTILKVQVAPSKGLLFAALAEWVKEQALKKLPAVDIDRLNQLFEKGEKEGAIQYYSERMSALWDEERLHLEWIASPDAAAFVALHTLV